MTGAAADEKHWREVADQWIAWARTPGHDAFWAYRDAFAAFVGAGEGMALEIGCGEGRISRLLVELGYDVTASDIVPAFVEAARQADSAQAYVVAPAHALPIAEGSFDLVMAYNMLMDVEDVPSVVAEARRVLKPSGRMIVSLVHPFADGGRFEGEGDEAAFVVRRDYFGRHRFEAKEDRGGIAMHFAGWSQPLESYARAFAAAGFAITAIREPMPAAAAPPYLERWRRIPLFLWLELRPVAR